MAKKEPLAELTPKQRERLERLEAEIQFDKLTSAFSIEGRDNEGRKRWTMFSASTSREGGESWAPSDVAVVECLLSKHVAMASYRDAVRRKVLPASVANAEAKVIRANYDNNLANLLKQGDDE